MEKKKIGSLNELGYHENMKFPDTEIVILGEKIDENFVLDEEVVDINDLLNLDDITSSIYVPEGSNISYRRYQDADFVVNFLVSYALGKALDRTILPKIKKIISVMNEYIRNRDQNKDGSGTKIEFRVIDRKTMQIIHMIGTPEEFYEEFMKVQLENAK